MKKLAAMLTAAGAPGLFVFAMLDGLGLPVPGGVDALLIYLASQMPGRAYELALLAIVGSVIGNFVLFMLARKGGEIYLRKHTVSRSGARFRRWFQHYGLLTVFIAAFVPLPVMPLKIFVLCSGALGSGPRSFLAVFTGARIARYSALAALGAAMGNDAWNYLIAHKWDLVGFAVVLFLVMLLLVKLADWRRARRGGLPGPPEVPESGTGNLPR